MDSNVKLVLGAFLCAVSALKRKEVYPTTELNKTLLQLRIELDRAITEGKPTEDIEYLIGLVKELKH